MATNPITVDLTNWQEGLGRVYRPDTRDRKYRARSAAQTLDTPTQFAQKLAQVLAMDLEEIVATYNGGRWYRNYVVGPLLNQRKTSQCTVYCMANCIQAGPRQNLVPTDDATMLRRYIWAQQNDEWPGEDYDGTSGRAAAQEYRSEGYLLAFYGLTTVMEMRKIMLSGLGPIAFGSDHYSGMDNVDKRGYVWPTGYWRGGHEIMYCGYNHTVVAGGSFTKYNSWGRWGIRGSGKCHEHTDSTVFLLEESAGDAYILEETIAA